MIVCKFGGSSVASVEGAKNIKKIAQQNKNRKIIVVSALGKTKDYNYKITDKLIELYNKIIKNDNYFELIDIIFEKYINISSNLNVNINWNKYKNELFKKIEQNAINKAYLLSRGEYFSALIYAKYLNYKFIDAKNYIKFNKNGKINKKITKKLLKKLNFNYNYVIGGFYGSDYLNNICLMDRGGSDVTGAIISTLLNCEIYEKYTDVVGVYNKNPNKFYDAKKQTVISYKDAIIMAQRGDEVIHKDALLQLQNSNSLLLVKNTFTPEVFGTLVVKETL